MRICIETFIAGDATAQPSVATTVSAVAGGTGSAEAATVRVASDMTNITTSDNFSIERPDGLLSDQAGRLRCGRQSLNCFERSQNGPFIFRSAGRNRLLRQRFSDACREFIELAQL